MSLNTITGQGLRNTPTGGYKTHRSKFPIPVDSTKQPVVNKQPEGSAVITTTWEPYNPSPFYDQYDIIGYRVKRIDKKGRRTIIRQKQPFQQRSSLKYSSLKFLDDSTSNTYFKT